MSYFKRCSIKSVLCIFAFLLIAPLTIVVFLIYQNTNRLLMKTAEDYSSQIISYTNNYANDYINELAKSIYPLVSNTTTIDFLLEEQKASSFENYENMLKLLELINTSLVLQRNDIYTIIITDGEDRVCSTKSRIYAFDSLELYNDKIMSVGSFELLGVRKVQNTNVLTFGLKFYPNGLSNQTATMLVDVYLSAFARSFTSGDAKSGFSWMTNNKGQIIYHPDASLVGSYIDMSKEADFFETDSYKLVNTGTDLIMVTKKFDYDKMLIYEASVNIIGEELGQLRTTLMLIGIICILFTVGIITFFSYIYTKPIYELKATMQHIAKGDLSIKSPSQRLAEFSSLSDGFNSMIIKLERLIEDNRAAQFKEKEMEITIRESMLQFMQSTINPHFLYNTLELINSYAILEDNMDISRMTRNLAAFFRYSVSSMHNKVSLGDEIKHTLTYLNIQKERFSGLVVQTNLSPESCGNISAVRLMVQPLVENAFRHGYDAHLMAPTYIGIEGRDEKDRYVVSIQDHGKGMTPQQIIEFEESFSHHEYDVSGSNSEMMNHLKHIGLWNVHYRLRLMYGSNYGLHIASSNASGTIIEIFLPKEGVENASTNSENTDC